MIRVFLFFFFLLGGAAHAASSDWVVTDQYAARLIVAEAEVAPEAKRLSAGLEIHLEGNWKTYWKYPGEVGLPPELRWDASTNIASTQLFYPVPDRFTSFDIENYGYGQRVVFPIEIELAEAGQGANIALDATLLVCDDICIPADVSIFLGLDAGTAPPNPETTALIAQALSEVPEERSNALRANWQNGAFIVESSALPFGADVFPHDDTGLRYGQPSFTNSGDETLVRFNAETDGEVPPRFVTITTGRKGFTVPITIVDEPLATEEARTWITWLMAAGFALLGGLILNIMPCVLPVLSIKFAGVLAASNKTAHEIRAGFLATSAGILIFALALALLVIVLRSIGVSFGLGMQFQSPVFLTFMIAVLVLFAVNLFGLFEFRLPQAWTQHMDDGARKEGLWGDFLTGTFAALLATPCSAPFLGTAITYAFTGSAFDALTVFLFLGIGLASPYLLAALRPSLVTSLPRPGAWMGVVRSILGVGVFGTALWLTYVLTASTGPWIALAITSVLTGAIVMWARSRAVLPMVTSLGIVVIAVLSPLGVQEPKPSGQADVAWDTFDPSAIAAHVSEGRTVFVDVTADWCLTCKVNKSIVLDAAEITAILERDDVIAMQADWTTPNESIRSYLEQNDRFGIPFNIVYGPKAPEGIALPELLSISGTKDAIEQANPSL
ncbi:MAG: protein-disulfide reductase DsbD domain-containing protein [Pseudomonadota bacterium]